MTGGKDLENVRCLGRRVPRVDERLHFAAPYLCRSAIIVVYELKSSSLDTQYADMLCLLPSPSPMDLGSNLR